MSGPIIPLSQRRGDLLFVVAFALFTASSLLSDALHALAIRPAGFDPNATYAALVGDHYFASNPQTLQVRLYISGFVFAPITAALVVAFVKGWEEIRPLALLYAGAMIVGVSEFIAWDLTSGTPPERLGLFFAFNGPYLLVPLLLAARMWREAPFSRRA
ncbi:MAG: DUF2781 domain-containing protein [Nannocystis sp.]|nr:DUF2781 domain-containing protein [Nannocystis sp.]MBK8265048.1 DUF2781 domain-containing protein [Nannocystis sp.]